MNFKEKLVATLICLMKHDDKEFIKCKRNDFIVWLLNLTRVDPDKFFEKICSTNI